MPNQLLLSDESMLGQRWPPTRPKARVCRVQSKTSAARLTCEWSVRLSMGLQPKMILWKVTVFLIWGATQDHRNHQIWMETPLFFRDLFLDKPNQIGSPLGLPTTLMQSPETILRSPQGWFWPATCAPTWGSVTVGEYVVQVGAMTTTVVNDRGIMTFNDQKPIVWTKKWTTVRYNNFQQLYTVVCCINLSETCYLFASLRGIIVTSSSLPGDKHGLFYDVLRTLRKLVVSQSWCK